MTRNPKQPVSGLLTAAKLRRIRLDAGINIRTASIAAGYYRQYLSALEGGKAPIDTDVLEKLGNVYGVTFIVCADGFRVRQ